MNDTNINLGAEARDTITGFSGVVVSRHEYLNGCVRLGIQPKELKDGKPIDAIVFDIQQLAQVEPPKANVELGKTGGPRDEPQRQAAPAR